VTMVPLGIGDPDATPPNGIATCEGRFACLLLAPAEVRGAARFSLQLACHRGLSAFLPLSPDLREIDFDNRSVRTSLDGLRGRSVVALEPPISPCPVVVATGTDWLRARRAARAARNESMAALVALSRSLPHESAVLTERAGNPLALLLTRTEACDDLGAAAHAAWRDLVVSAPWPVFGFTGGVRE